MRNPNEIVYFLKKTCNFPYCVNTWNVDTLHTSLGIRPQFFFKHGLLGDSVVASVLFALLLPLCVWWDHCFYYLFYCFCLFVCCCFVFVYVFLLLLFVFFVFFGFFFCFLFFFLGGGGWVGGVIFGHDYRKIAGHVHLFVYDVAVLPLLLCAHIFT